MYPLSTGAGVFPSFILVLMGSIDCATTVIGLLYFGAAELNPFLAGLVSNIPAFIALKLTATLCIGGTCILAYRILGSADKSSRGFRIGNVAVRAAYAGLVVFLAVVVVNNVTVLLA